MTLDDGKTIANPTLRDTISESRTEDLRELLTFFIGGIEFGLPIHTIQEIVRPPKITPVPQAAHYVRGLTNLRGNVLPVIEPRLRFGIGEKDRDEAACRVIVVEIEDNPTGMIIDAVHEVLQAKEANIEPPPSIVCGVDSQYLKGVVKLDEGERLVLLLDPEGFELEETIAQITKKSSSIANRSGRNEPAAQVEEDHEQLVTFRLAGEEYGFPILEVQEIIRVPEITQIPNAPYGIEGITSLRNRVLPIMDLRTKFHFNTLASEMESLLAQIHDFENKHLNMFCQIEHALREGSIAEEVLGYETCAFRAWRESLSTADQLIQEQLRPFENADRKFHDGLEAVAKKLRSNDLDEASQTFQQRVKRSFREIEILFKKCLKNLRQRQDGRCLVVNSGGAELALRIDAVNEVLQVSKKSIETAPETIGGQNASREQLRGIAKLDEGRRLTMILDAGKLLSKPEVEAISTNLPDKTSSFSKKENLLSEEDEGSNNDRQLVTFKVAQEEFATDIMLVHEIIRLEKVTPVPHAPNYVEGVVNLRGDVLPVINLRKRFSMTEKKYNESTRVVVVEVNGLRTGVIVDQVTEVINFPEKAIEEAPAIVQAGLGAETLEGIGKVDDGNRMILILRPERLLGDQDMAAFMEKPFKTSPKTDRSQTASKQESNLELLGATSG